MSRASVILQIAIGWLPVWALFTLLIMTAHGSPFLPAALAGLRMIAAAAVLAVAVNRLITLLPWPHPLNWRFVVAHVLAACTYAAASVVANAMIESVVQSVIRGRLALAIVLGPGFAPTLIFGIWLYVMTAGVLYGNRAAQRAARIEALAARTQLAALRAQVHPHFLFNALHAVVQLIPVDPRAATHAAEQLAGALRTAIGEERDLVPLAEELAFVRRYLAIESIRFGDRLDIRERIDADALEAMLPSFALQTLVENSVRHGAAPRAEATMLSIIAGARGGMLRLTVEDNGAGAGAEQIEGAGGTGLRRLRERLKYLYGARAQLDIAGSAGSGLRATLTLPLATTPPDLPDHADV